MKSLTSTPECGHRLTRLAGGPLVSVWDWDCAGADSSCDEENAAFEIVLVRRGSFVRECGATRVVGDSSVALFWNSGDVFRVRHPVAGGDRCTILKLSASGIRELLEAVREGDRSPAGFPVTHVSVPNNLFLAHRSLLASIEDSESAIAVEERATELAFSLARRASMCRVGRGHCPPRAREYAARVREVLAARFLENLTLARIARDVCCSPFHLSRLVAACEGIRIHEMLVQLRLREGLRLLMETTEPISSIAIGTGFSSHSHFSAAFRRHFGMTPGQARAGRLGRASTSRLASVLRHDTKTIGEGAAAPLH